LLIAADAAAQSSPRWYVGPTAFVQSERRKGNISEYWKRQEDRTSNAGYGLRVLYKPTRHFSVSSGVNYSMRTYHLFRSYNHCVFLPPGSPCLQYLLYLDSYRYETAEVPLQLNAYLASSRHLGLYGGLNWVNAVSFRSNYLRNAQDVFGRSWEKFQFLSTSVSGLLGLEVTFGTRVKLNCELTQRMVQSQRADFILGETHNAWIQSRWDAWGANVSLLVGLGNVNP